MGNLTAFACACVHIRANKQLMEADIFPIERELGLGY